MNHLTELRFFLLFSMCLVVHNAGDDVKCFNPTQQDALNMLTKGFKVAYVVGKKKITNVVTCFSGKFVDAKRPGDIVYAIKIENQPIAFTSSLIVQPDGLATVTFDKEFDIPPEHVYYENRGDDVIVAYLCNPEGTRQNVLIGYLPSDKDHSAETAAIASQFTDNPEDFKVIQDGCS